MITHLVLCPACEATPTYRGKTRLCAFSAGSFSSKNWNCATVRRFRDVATAYLTYNDDQRAAAIPVPWTPDMENALEETASFIVIEWYKARGRTEGLWLTRETAAPRALELAEALAIIQAWDDAEEAEERVKAERRRAPSFLDKMRRVGPAGDALRAVMGKAPGEIGASLNARPLLGPAVGTAPWLMRAVKTGRVPKSLAHVPFVEAPSWKRGDSLVMEELVYLDEDEEEEHPLALLQPELEGVEAMRDELHRFQHWRDAVVRRADAAGRPKGVGLCDWFEQLAGGTGGEDV